MQFIIFRKLIELKHTFFGFAFVCMGVFLGIFFYPGHAKELFYHSSCWMLILPAFLFARISGMSFNQLIDRHIDAKNPRTHHRVLPSGKASPKQVFWMAWIHLLAFILCCLFINTICFWFSLAASFLLVFYSYTKRFTKFSHFILGLIQLLSPWMAAIAISGQYCLPAFLLGLSAFFLISGNDIIYAIQDIEFDRGYLLYSMPAKIGAMKSLSVAFFLHMSCSFCFALIGLLMHSWVVTLFLPFSSIFIIFGFYLSCLKTLKKGNSTNPHFFWCNTIICFAALFFIILGGLWEGML